MSGVDYNALPEKKSSSPLEVSPVFFAYMGEGEKTTSISSGDDSRPPLLVQRSDRK